MVEGIAAPLVSLPEAVCMTFFTDCIPCQYGLHEHHHPMIQAAPEGGFGGAECPCTGDCAVRNAERIKGRSQGMVGPPIPEGFFDQLRSLTSPDAGKAIEEDETCA